jgi:acylphosphatase
VSRAAFVVRGRVQGVGFRWATRAEAQRLGLRGFVRNRADGAVEGEAVGPGPALAALRAWLRHGPRGARVDALDWTEVTPTSAPDDRERDRDRERASDHESETDAGDGGFTIAR